MPTTGPTPFHDTSRTFDGARHLRGRMCIDEEVLAGFSEPRSGTCLCMLLLALRMRFDHGIHTPFQREPQLADYRRAGLQSRGRTTMATVAWFAGILRSGQAAITDWH
jgi:hypothetical protein